MHCFRASLARDQLKLDELIRLESGQILFKATGVNEDVLLTSIESNESVLLLWVVPFDCSGSLRYCRFHVSDLLVICWLIHSSKCLSPHRWAETKAESA